MLRVGTIHKSDKINIENSHPPFEGTPIKLVRSIFRKTIFILLSRKELTLTFFEIFFLEEYARFAKMLLLLVFQEIYRTDVERAIIIYINHFFFFKYFV